ncbi:hypothetical protein SCH01S_53_00380 [Sphingomonas changbaiensis NBRC 104936]|uniref:Restriction endonuclease type IV Mrr domain-containing protein n=1 Tax=Sphingomonas changbaiensis NBRC 104936 TaxID=1219043 RepID=A0A0E9MU80_9SPHN|nr:restriction endonuclease [Sphingomonas changbaiensis]GAO40966.1 hypothetical protein SCH01S_53_00380 [Sphingomonas changbaiensis NBRC 104936]
MATRYLQQLKDFYTLGSDTLWITFARGALWWAFAAPKVVLRESPAANESTSYRHTLGPWRCTDIKGGRLEVERLSTRLTQLAGYRQTICSVRESAYLLRRINAEPEPIVAAAQAACDRMAEAVAPLIANLHWADFELFVDLLFARAGWRRISALGGRMKDFDMLIEQPATGERACVQVKSATSQPVLDACYRAFQERQDAERCFFVCHTAAAAIRPPEASDRPFHLWDIGRLADFATDHGLVRWLIERAG